MMSRKEEEEENGTWEENAALKSSETEVSGPYLAARVLIAVI